MLVHLSCMVTILMYAQCNLSFEESNKVDLSKNILINIRSHELPLQKCIPLNILMPDTPPDMVACRWTLAHGAEEENQ